LFSVKFKIPLALAKHASLKKRQLYKVQQLSLYKRMQFYKFFDVYGAKIEEIAKKNRFIKSNRGQIRRKNIFLVEKNVLFRAAIEKR
jgi:hypothetical protein